MRPYSSSESLNLAAIHHSSSDTRFADNCLASRFSEKQREESGHEFGAEKQTSHDPLVNSCRASSSRQVHQDHLQTFSPPEVPSPSRFGRPFSAQSSSLHVTPRSVAVDLGDPFCFDPFQVYQKDSKDPSMAPAKQAAPLNTASSSATPISPEPLVRSLSTSKRSFDQVISPVGPSSQASTSREDVPSHSSQTAAPPRTLPFVSSRHVASASQPLLQGDQTQRHLPYKRRREAQSAQARNISGTMDSEASMVHPPALRCSTSTGEIDSVSRSGSIHTLSSVDTSITQGFLYRTSVASLLDRFLQTEDEQGHQSLQSSPQEAQASQDRAETEEEGAVQQGTDTERHQYYTGESSPSRISSISGNLPTSFVASQDEHEASLQSHERLMDVIQRLQQSNHAMLQQQRHTLGMDESRIHSNNESIEPEQQASPHQSLTPVIDSAILMNSEDNNRQSRLSPHSSPVESRASTNILTDRLASLRARVNESASELDLWTRRQQELRERYLLRASSERPRHAGSPSNADEDFTRNERTVSPSASPRRLFSLRALLEEERDVTGNEDQSRNTLLPFRDTRRHVLSSPFRSHRRARIDTEPHSQRTTSSQVSRVNGVGRSGLSYQSSPAPNTHDHQPITFGSGGSHDTARIVNARSSETTPSVFPFHTRHGSDSGSIPRLPHLRSRSPISLSFHADGSHDSSTTEAALPQDVHHARPQLRPLALSASATHASLSINNRMDGQSDQRLLGRPTEGVNSLEARVLAHSSARSSSARTAALRRRFRPEIDSRPGLPHSTNTSQRREEINLPQDHSSRDRRTLSQRLNEHSARLLDEDEASVDSSATSRWQRLLDDALGFPPQLSATLELGSSSNEMQRNDYFSQFSRQMILGAFGGAGLTSDPADYLSDEEFSLRDTYEGLLQLSSSIGEARLRSTPPHIIASFPTKSFARWCQEKRSAASQIDDPVYTSCKGKGKAKEDESENTMETSCSICLEDYLDDDILMSVPCEHIFHADCVKVCRSFLVTALINLYM